MNALLLVAAIALLFYFLIGTRDRMGSCGAHERPDGQTEHGVASAPTGSVGTSRPAARQLSVSGFVLLLLLLTLPMMLIHGMAPPSAALHMVLFWATLVIPIVILSYLWGAGALPGSRPLTSQGAEDVERRELEPRVEMEPIAERVAREMAIDSTHVEGTVVWFEGRMQADAGAAYERLTASLAELGRSPRLLEGEQGRAIVLAVPGVEQAGRRTAPTLGVPILLFVASLGTTVWAGASHQGINLMQEPGRFMVGLPYALALLGILLVHELGHYVAARHHHVDVTPPYFIPVPMGLGTFGAFIQIKGAIPDRRKVFDIGVAGPLAGLVVAIPALIWGLKAAVVAPSGPGVSLTSSVLLTWLYGLVNGGTVPPDHVVRLSAVGFAGWLGLLVTAINLVPVGQLDGGHVAYALFGRRRAETVGWVAFFLLLALGAFVWSGWLTWAFLIFFLGGVKHQPALNELPSPGPARRAVGAIAFILLFLIMAPVPHQLMAALGIRCPYI